MIIILSIISLHPLRGALVGFFIGGSFLFGHLVFVIIRVLLLGIDNVAILELYTSLDPVSGSFQSIVSALIGLASLGFLSGLIGYIFNEISPVSFETHPLVFRDYWSQIYSWNKSGSPEYPKLDRKLSNWSVVRGSWKQLFMRKIQEPKEELIFAPRSSNQKVKDKIKKNNESPMGDLYLASSSKFIGEFYDFKYLISKYRPKLIHDLSSPFQLILSEKLSGVFWLALERILANIINIIVKSKKIILLYVTLCIGLVVATTIITATNFYPVNSVIISVAALGIPALGPVVLAILFRGKSKELVKIRPDESYLLFSIYLCLFLVYPIIIWIALYPPSEFVYYIPSVWAGEWFWNWTLPFSIPSFILGIGYIFFHRETQNVSTYFFDNRQKNKRFLETIPFKENEEIHWIKKNEKNPDEQPDFFWVIRFMYYWRYELTFPLPHYDWERVELWIDAKSGDLKWIVSDYHFKELWYKVKEELPDIYVKILSNWHTPIPVVDSNETKEYQRFFDTSTLKLLNYFFRGFFGKVRYFLSEILRKIKEKIKKTPKPMIQEVSPINPKKTSYENWIRDFGQGDFAEVLKRFPYEEIRYIRGVDSDINREMWYKTNKSTEKI
ncbi:MAG: hypothetical protein NWF10_05205 [Candidatus Bathyarchaeota archaeon]|nr:hypothetical protein [Candidatus Bathyarchaeota archaeon]